MPSTIQGGFGVAVVGLKELSRDLRQADAGLRKAVRDLHSDFSMRAVSAARSRAQRHKGGDRFADLIRPIRSLSKAGIRYPRQGGGTPSARGKTPALGWLFGSQGGPGVRQFERPWKGDSNRSSTAGALVTSLLGAVFGKAGTAFGSQMVTGGDVTRLFPDTYAVTPALAQVAPTFGEEYERRLVQILKKVDTNV